MGKGGTLTLLVNGKTVGEGRVKKRRPINTRLRKAGLSAKTPARRSISEGRSPLSPGIRPHMGADVSARCRLFGGKAFVATSFELSESHDSRRLFL
jgi:hypothetical protein